MQPLLLMQRMCDTGCQCRPRFARKIKSQFSSQEPELRGWTGSTVAACFYLSGPVLMRATLMATAVKNLSPRFSISPLACALLQKAIEYIDGIDANLLHRVTALHNKQCRQPGLANELADVAEVIGF